VSEEVLPVARELLGAADAPRVTIGVRPEDLEVVESGGLLIEADVVEEFGADAYVYGRTRFGGSEQQIIARVHGRNSPTKGDTLHVRPRRGHVHLFRVSDGARLVS
jgi:multiple sugar transport system ATP-binding protein